MTKQPIEMAREDWLSLLGFLQAANDVRSLMGKAVKAGKQQIAVSAHEVERWLDTDVPADVWVKLGALMARGEPTKEQEL